MDRRQYLITHDSPSPIKLLTGNVPRQLYRLTRLHVMDLANNSLSGVIPACLGNLTGMVSEVQFEAAK